MFPRRVDHLRRIMNHITGRFFSSTGPCTGVPDKSVDLLALPSHTRVQRGSPPRGPNRPGALPGSHSKVLAVDPHGVDRPLVVAGPFSLREACLRPPDVSRRTRFSMMSYSSLQARETSKASSRSSRRAAIHELTQLSPLASSGRRTADPGRGTRLRAPPPQE